MHCFFSSHAFYRLFSHIYFVRVSNSQTHKMYKIKYLASIKYTAKKIRNITRNSSEKIISVSSFVGMPNVKKNVQKGPTLVMLYCKKYTEILH